MSPICPCCQKAVSLPSEPDPAEDIGALFACDHCQSVLKWEGERLKVVFESNADTTSLEEESALENPADLEEKSALENPADLEEKSALENPADLEEKSALENPADLEEKSALENPADLEEKSALENPADLEEKSALENPADLEEKSAEAKEEVVTEAQEDLESHEGDRVSEEDLEQEGLESLESVSDLNQTNLGQAEDLELESVQGEGDIASLSESGEGAIEQYRSQNEESTLDEAKSQGEREDVSVQEGGGGLKGLEAEEQNPVDEKQDFSDVESYGNSTGADMKGFLRYDLVIEGIDSSEIKTQVLLILEDPRFRWSAKEIMQSEKEGVVVIKNLNPVKAFCLVSELAFISVELSWKQYKALSAPSE